jgi:hypothetical protein
MTINLPSDVQVVSEVEAIEALDARAGVPWYRANRRPRPAPQRPVSVHAAATLNRLYSRPAPADRVPEATAPATTKKRTRKSASKPVRRSRVPKSPNGPEWWRSFLGKSPRAGSGGSTVSLTALGKSVLSQLTKLILALSALATLTTLLLLRVLWQ